MSLSFEIAVEDDVRAIAAVRNVAAEHLTGKYGQGRWSHLATARSVQVHEFMRPKFQRTLIARDGSKVIATLCLQTKKPWAIDVKYFTRVSKALYLIGMAVHPDWQGKGVGRLILKEAGDIARNWPSNAIRLDAWDADAGAGPFYVKCGFRDVGHVIYRTAPIVYYEMLL